MANTAETLDELQVLKPKPVPLSSKFRQVREGTLNRFYTRFSIGEILANQFQEIHPAKVLDLGAGEGSLSASVGKRWNNAEIITVDIDPDCVSEMHSNIISSGAMHHIHHIHDVLNSDLSNALAQHGSFDVGVCNPPFFKPQWKEDFSKILIAADLHDACQTTADVTSEILFLAQNLKLIRDGGAIAIIVPDGILTGWKTQSLRRNLLTKHRIDCVLQLPRHSFHDTEARCFILFITKHGNPEKKIKLLRYDASLGLSEPIFIDVQEAEKRLDFDYHFHTEHTDERLATLRQLGADIRRGSISTVESKAISYPIFHTSDFSAYRDGEVHLSSAMPKIDPRIVVAEPGDILMARVDRNLHQKIAMVISGKVALTDCVYRIRVAPELRNAAFEAMRSQAGSAKIHATTKGVGARLIGKADLLDIPFGIDSKISFQTEELF